MADKNIECPILSLTVPCYNEEEGLEVCMTKLMTYLENLKNSKKISKESFIVLVDDGSIDNTFEIIAKLHKQNSYFKGIKFTRNFGSQSAILAGLHTSYSLGADCVISIDADLQQELSAIDKFLEEYKKGNDIVFGVRSKYHKGAFLKSMTSKLFYKVTAMLGANLVPDHSEFRLVSKKALKILSNYREHNIFLRGLFVDFGLTSSKIEYNIIERNYGKTKFNCSKLFQLAINGITSFSTIPLRLVAILGIFMAIVSFAIGLETIYEKYVLQNTIPGWTTIVVTTTFLAGIQILCIGIIGEYLGRIYNEVKARPRYINDIELFD